MAQNHSAEWRAGYNACLAQVREMRDEAEMSQRLARIRSKSYEVVMEEAYQEGFRMGRAARKRLPYFVGQRDRKLLVIACVCFVIAAPIVYALIRLLG